MRVSELIDLAEILSEEVYEPSVWIGFINAAIDDLTPVARMVATKENIPLTIIGKQARINMKDELSEFHDVLNVFYTPNGKGPRELRKLAIADNWNRGWKRIGDIAILQNVTDGTARIDYFISMKHVKSKQEDIYEVTGLPEEYHQLILLYACAKSQQKEEELEDANHFYQEYAEKKQEFAQLRADEIR